MGRPKKHPPKDEPRIVLHSFSLTPEALDALKELSQDATDFLGRMVSSSAIVRALIRQARKQGRPAAEALFLEIERELDAGVRWGGKKE